MSVHLASSASLSVFGTHGFPPPVLALGSETPLGSYGCGPSPSALACGLDVDHAGEHRFEGGVIRATKGSAEGAMASDSTKRSSMAPGAGGVEAVG